MSGGRKGIATVQIRMTINNPVKGWSKLLVRIRVLRLAVANLNSWKTKLRSRSYWPTDSLLPMPLSSRKSSLKSSESRKPFSSSPVTTPALKVTPLPSSEGHGLPGSRQKVGGWNAWEMDRWCWIIRFNALAFSANKCSSRTLLFLIIGKQKVQNLNTQRTRQRGQRKRSRVDNCGGEGRITVGRKTGQTLLEKGNPCYHINFSSRNKHDDDDDNYALIASFLTL